MRTPFGKNCRFFYGDYHRGRNQEECRLLSSSGFNWSLYLCEKCLVPDILLANGCEHMQLNPELKKAAFFLRPQVQISAYCEKSKSGVDKPRVGCGQCHPSLDAFVMLTDEPDTSD